MITKLISEYIKSNRRLVLPTLGAFIRKDDSGEVVFVPFLKSDDGVLKSLIASGMSVSQSAAEAMAGEFIMKVGQEINTRGGFVIDGLGTIKRDVAGVLTMSYDTNVVSSAVPQAPVDEPIVAPESVVAPSVQSAPIVQSVPTTQSAPVAQPAQATQSVQSAPSTQTTQPATAVQPEAETPKSQVSEDTIPIFEEEPAGPIIEDFIISDSEPVSPVVRPAEVRPTTQPRVEPTPVAPAANQVAEPRAAVEPEPAKTENSGVVDLEIPDYLPKRKEYKPLDNHASQIDKLYNAEPITPSRTATYDYQERKPTQSHGGGRVGGVEPAARPPKRKKRLSKRPKTKTWDLLLIIAIIAIIAGLLIFLYGMLTPDVEVMQLG